MNGDYDHGCTELCQIDTSTTTDDSGATVTAWDCTHYYLGYESLLSLEVPHYRTYCEWKGRSARRRLQQLASDYDHQGRLLSHSPQYAKYYTLPENEN